MVNLGGFAGGVTGGATVAIVLQGVDRFSGVINNATKELTGFNRFAATAFKGVAIGAGVAATAFTGLSVSAVQAASDFEEVESKFETVFDEVTFQAKLAAKELQESFGLSGRAAKQLLSDTGDLLSGFGFTDRAALDLSEKVNKLAVDLASFTNIQGGAERASRALTKALLGERESVKELGIAILESDVQQRLLEKGQQDLTGFALKQAKALATLELAIEQSGNALGDYNRTQDSTANRLKRLRNRFEDLKIELGQELLPAFDIVLTKVETDLLPVLQNLDSFINVKLQNSIKRLGLNFRDLGLEIGGVFDELEDLTGLNNLEVVILSLTESLNLFLQPFKLFFTTLRDGLDALGDFLDNIEKVRTGVEDFNIKNIFRRNDDDFDNNRNDVLSLLRKSNAQGGMTVNIENVNGTDPDDLSTSLQRQLQTLITT